MELPRRARIPPDRCLTAATPAPTFSVLSLAPQSSAALPEGHDVPQFGGPSSVGGQMAEDAIVVPQYRLQGLQDHFAPWFEFKTRLNDDIGLQFNIDESMFYQVATDSPGESDAASGILT